MKSFTLYNVFTEYDLDWLKTDCNVCKEDICNLKYGDIDCDYDYAQLALVDEDNKKCILWCDNMHTSIKEIVIGFKLGLNMSQIKYQINKKYIYNEDLKNKYGGVRY